MIEIDGQFFENPMNNLNVPYCSLQYNITICKMYLKDLLKEVSKTVIGKTLIKVGE